MLKEQAISLLTQVKELILGSESWLDSAHQPIEEAFSMAIEAIRSTQPNTSNVLNALDCVSKQAVIKAVDKHTFDTDEGLCLDEDITCILEEIPSAQPEQKHGRIFQEIVVEYPSYNTYPEYKGKPYFSIKYTENGQEFIGYSTYNPEVLSEYLKEYFMPSAQSEPSQVARDIATIIENEQDMRVMLSQQWIPVSERLPEELTTVLITDKDGDVFVARFIEVIDGCAEWTTDGVIAWMPLPEPYRKEGGEK